MYHASGLFRLSYLSPKTDWTQSSVSAAYVVVASTGNAPPLRISIAVWPSVSLIGVASSRASPTLICEPSSSGTATHYSGWQLEPLRTAILPPAGGPWTRMGHCRARTGGYRAGAHGQTRKDPSRGRALAIGPCLRRRTATSGRSLSPLIVGAVSGLVRRSVTKGVVLSPGIGAFAHRFGEPTLLATGRHRVQSGGADSSFHINESGGRSMAMGSSGWELAYWDFCRSDNEWALMARTAAIHLPTARHRSEPASSESRVSGISNRGDVVGHVLDRGKLHALIRGHDLGFDSEREFSRLEWVPGPQCETPQKPDPSAAANDQGRQDYRRDPHPPCRRPVSSHRFPSSQ